MKNFKDFITEDTYEEALSQIKKEKSFSGYKITPKYKFSFRGKSEAGIAVHVPFLKEPVVFVEDSPEGSEVQAGGKKVRLPSRWSVWMNKTIKHAQKTGTDTPTKTGDMGWRSEKEDRTIKPLLQYVRGKVKRMQKGK